VITTPNVETESLPDVKLEPVFADNPAPHIALILPLKSPSWARYADLVRQGFIAAATQQQNALPVRVYEATDGEKEVITLYRQALVNGALAVAGPLTHSGVNALANYSGISVPTLALNMADTAKDSGKLYYFGLTPEPEARQIAQIGLAKSHFDATIIRTNSSLSKRLVAAFTDEWKTLGGNITAEIIYTDNASVLANLPVAPWPPGMEPPPPPPPASAVVEAGPNGEIRPPKPPRPLPPPIYQSNMVFLVAETEKARLIRPYINPNIAVYGTSQLFKGSGATLANYDLNDIHFIDMPWLLQPDHPAVMIYPHITPAMSVERERLYAFGIDSYRLLQTMMKGDIGSSLPLDGVTGRIIQGSNHQLQREGVLALFKLGRGLTPEALEAIYAAKAAEKAAERAAARAAAESAVKEAATLRQ
jgi:outer membrane PBP1 activator LpoA protein